MGATVAGGMYRHSSFEGIQMLCGYGTFEIHRENDPQFEPEPNNTASYACSGSFPVYRTGVTIDSPFYVEPAWRRIVALLEVAESSKSRLQIIGQIKSVLGMKQDDLEDVW